MTCNEIESAINAVVSELEAAHAEHKELDDCPTCRFKQLVRESTLLADVFAQICKASFNTIILNNLGVPAADGVVVANWIAVLFMAGYNLGQAAALEELNARASK